MPLFKLQENRYINTDHVVEIKYTPANSMPAIMMPKTVPTDVGMPSQSSHPSYLNIELKNSAALCLAGEEADKAWTVFQQAMNQPGNTETR